MSDSTSDSTFLHPIRYFTSDSTFSPTLTVSVTPDSQKRKIEPWDYIPQTPQKTKRNFRGDKNQGKKQLKCAPPTIDSSLRETEQICGGVETYNE